MSSDDEVKKTNRAATLPPFVMREACVLRHDEPGVLQTQNFMTSVLVSAFGRN